jgi:hypothetical protein
LEALVQLLQVAAADEEAVRAFQLNKSDCKSASPAITSVTNVSNNLSSIVSSCMVAVSNQDPSAAHKALAGQALSILQRFDGV